MSDAGRQSFTDKASAALTPDSQKSTTSQVGDSIKSTMDSMASTVQPNNDKSATQKVGDAASGNANHNQESLLDKAKNAVGYGESKK